jgi:hypothetical protein
MVREESQATPGEQASLILIRWLDAPETSGGNDTPISVSDYKPPIWIDVGFLVAEDRTMLHLGMHVREDFAGSPTKILHVPKALILERKELV